MKLIKKARIRQLHAQFAPIMVLPLLITLITGSMFQIAVLTGNTRDFVWLLEWHRGKFGPVNLEMIYPVLNAFGLLMLLVTGFTMWWQMRPRKKKKLGG